MDQIEFVPVIDGKFGAASLPGCPEYGKDDLVAPIGRGIPKWRVKDL